MSQVCLFSPRLQRRLNQDRWYEPWGGANRRPDSADYMLLQNALATSSNFKNTVRLQVGEQHRMVRIVNRQGRLIGHYTLFTTT